MTKPAVRVDHLYKKFRRGEIHDTLRDQIPAIARRLLGIGSELGELGRQEFWALNDLCFEIARGEAVGVIGHNGAGKSTLLKHLTGILRPTRGVMQINGRVSALIEVGAGFHVDLTGRENIYLNGSILGMSIAEIRRKFDEIVAFSGLEAFLDTPVKRYSSGMFAKLGFSVAAHLEPEILLIDEVLSVGDFAFQQKGVAKMRAIAANGATVIFVSHNLKSVTDLCGRCLLLNRGRLAADGPTDEVVHGYLTAVAAQSNAEQAKDVAFEAVTLRGEGGPQSVFKPGERVVVDVAGHAVRDVNDVDVVLEITDAGFQRLLNVSATRLGGPALALRAGQKFRMSVAMQLHLAGGSYQVNVSAYRLDRQETVDAIAGASIVHIDAPMEGRGVVNTYPKLVKLEADPSPAPASVSATAAG